MLILTTRFYKIVVIVQQTGAIVTKALSCLVNWNSEVKLIGQHVYISGRI